MFSPFCLRSKNRPFSQHYYSFKIKIMQEKGGSKSYIDFAENMIRYDRFWETLKEKGISQYNLVTDYNISKSLLQRLRNNDGISTHSLNMLCTILDCRIEDIVEFVKDNEFISENKKDE